MRKIEGFDFVEFVEKSGLPSTPDGFEVNDTDCPHCGYPCLTPLGMKVHRAFSHNGANAEANRAIVRMYNAGRPISVICYWTSRGADQVRSVILRAQRYPKIYTHVTPEMKARRE
jgi:hypothetical protein